MEGARVWAVMGVQVEDEGDRSGGDDGSVSRRVGRWKARC